nr:uncharacterized protein LOC109025320 isoform X2 [Gorilla gorilla gorilla]
MLLTYAVMYTMSELENSLDTIWIQRWAAPPPPSPAPSPSLRLALSRPLRSAPCPLPPACPPPAPPRPLNPARLRLVPSAPPRPRGMRCAPGRRGWLCEDCGRSSWPVSEVVSLLLVNEHSDHWEPGSRDSFLPSLGLLRIPPAGLQDPGLTERPHRSRRPRARYAPGIMGEKSRRKGPAPRHADGKLGRTCDHPYAPWSFTPSSRAPTAWVRPPCPVWASRLQEHSPEPRRARGPPTRRAQAALYAPALRLRDHLDHFSILMTSCTSWLQAPQAPGLCRDEQSSRISVPQLSGAPILLPDLEGTKLSNFQVYRDVRRELTDSEAPRVTRCVHGNRSTALESFDITLLQVGTAMLGDAQMPVISQRIPS